LIDRQRGDQRDDSKRRAEQRRCRRAEQKGSADGGAPDADVAARAPAFDQEDGGDLQKLNAEGNSR
jgi:hypothetical protein